MRNLLEASTVAVKRFLRMGYGSIIVSVAENGDETEIDLTELAALESIGAADLAKIDGITNGTGAAGKALVLDANGTVLMPAPFRYDHNTTITAFATGGQASATALTGELTTSLPAQPRGIASNYPQQWAGSRSKSRTRALPRSLSFRQPVTASMPWPWICQSTSR